MDGVKVSSTSTGNGLISSQAQFTHIDPHVEVVHYDCDPEDSDDNDDGADDHFCSVASAHNLRKFDYRNSRGHFLLRRGLLEDVEEELEEELGTEDEEEGSEGCNKQTENNTHNASYENQNNVKSVESQNLEHGAVPLKSVCETIEMDGVVRRVWNFGWTVVRHHHLPAWLKDNDFLIDGHRPPLYSFKACLMSIFRIHTETGNIWTHLLGVVAFVGITAYFLTRPSWEVHWREKSVYSPFFICAIFCLGFSTSFHTFMCHSKKIGRLFNKLDYCGIALMTMGSFVPWLYYGFYCRPVPMIIYNVITIVLGVSCIVVSMWNKFASAKFRPVRAGVFIALGLSGCIPALHFVITDGFYAAVYSASLGWLALMAVIYIVGAIIYACRVPERLFPGKFDIWFQSHQIFHCCVVTAALIHLHGITRVASYRLTYGDCSDAEAAHLY